MCNAPLPLLCYLGADHLTLCGGGGGAVIFKKKFLQAFVGRKKLHAAQM